MTTAPKVIELVDRANPDKVIAHACATCRIVAMDERRARECCTCSGCGTALAEGRYGECPSCHASRAAAEEEVAATNEAKRLASAAQVPEAEYDGWVTWGDRGPQEGYFDSLDDLREHCIQNDLEPPERVWACYEVGFSLDADGIIERELEEHHEGAGDCIDGEATKLLQLALDSWCEEHASGVVSYTSDYSRAVVLNPAAWPRAKRDDADEGSDGGATEEPSHAE